jgi:hypothetical protein
VNSPFWKADIQLEFLINDRCVTHSRSGLLRTPPAALAEYRPSVTSRQPAASGRVQSFAADESGHSGGVPLNVGNLHDTGHSAEATPPAALAEDATVVNQAMAGRSLARAVSQYSP